MLVHQRVHALTSPCIDPFIYPTNLLGKFNGICIIWLQVKMRGPDQPPKPTRDPDPRSRPAIQTDPDLTIQTDPDLTIQTYDPDPFVLCWLDMFFFKVLKSIILCTTKYYSSTTLYYKVLLCTTKYDAG